MNITEWDQNCNLYILKSKLLGNVLLFSLAQSPKDQDGCTPFHLAASNGMIAVCEIILQNLKDKNPKNKKGLTPLHMAARNGHVGGEYKMYCRF